MVAASTKARAFTGDKSTQRRRGLMAKVYVAKKELELHEDDYRQILREETGEASLTQCSEAQIEKLVDRFKVLGFVPVKTGGGKGAALHPVARKARALWISLHHLNVVENPSEKALEAFAKRQLGCDRLVWAKQSHGFRLIEALKQMGARNGWRQSDCSGKPLDPRMLNESLCEAILVKLQKSDFAPASWTINDAAFRLYGIKLGAGGPVSMDEYILLAKKLGDSLRKHGGGA